MKQEERPGRFWDGKDGLSWPADRDLSADEAMVIAIARGLKEQSNELSRVASALERIEQDISDIVGVEHGVGFLKLWAEVRGAIRTEVEK
jgi:hypothetical protein